MIPISFLKECFEHQADGTLVWRERPAHHFTAVQHQRRVNTQHAGKAVTTRNADGYLVASLQYEGRQRKLLVSRIVWAMHHGAWPEMLVDHVNRVRDDNRIDNLRAADHQLNATNRCIKAGPFPFMRGVTRCHSGFISRIFANKRAVYLGTFPTAQLAHGAFLRAAVARAAGADFMGLTVQARGMLS